MLKLILSCLFIMLASSGCNETSSSQKAEIESADTATITEEVIRVYDSVEQKKAFGNARFGMNVKEYFKMKGQSESQRVGRYQYTIVPLFSPTTGLYEVRIESPWINSLWYNSTVKDVWQNIIDIISEKYGTTSNQISFPDPRLWEPEQSTLIGTHGWQIGDKTINVKIRRVGSSFSVECSIQSQHLFEIAEGYFDKERAKAKEKVEKAREADVDKF